MGGPSLFKMASIKFELLGIFLFLRIKRILLLMLDLPRNIAAHVKIFIGIDVDDYQDVSSTQHYF